MRRLQIPHAESVKSMLQNAIGKSSQAFFLHRLHCVTLVCAGMGCAEVAKAFGDDRRSVQRWVSRFLESGVDGLRDSRSPGRPKKLGSLQLQQLRLTLQADRLAGVAPSAWDAEALRVEIEQRFGITYSRKHCGRLLDSLYFPGSKEVMAEPRTTLVRD